MATECIMIKVCGVVQGVGFRYATQREALRLGVYGYVRNLTDGSVEILAYGDSEQIASLISWLKAGGPRGARVDKITIADHCPTTEWRTFSVRY